MSVAGPELRTARLRLRPLTMDDHDAHYAIVGSDPQVTWNRAVHTREESLALFASRLSHWARHGFGMWAVLDGATGALLGHGGLQYLGDTGDVELGYYLGRAAWGRGYATELGRAALAFGFDRLGLASIVAVVRPDNAASQRVLAKLGFRYGHDGRHHGTDVQVWRISR